MWVLTNEQRQKDGEKPKVMTINAYKLSKIRFSIKNLKEFRENFNGCGDHRKSRGKKNKAHVSKLRHYIFLLLRKPIGIMNTEMYF